MSVSDGGEGGEREENGVGHAPLGLPVFGISYSMMKSDRSGLKTDVCQNVGS